MGGPIGIDQNSQASERENTGQGKPLLPRPVEPQDNRQRQREEHKVHDDVEDLVDDEELVPIDALGLDARIPVTPQRAALQGTDQKDGGAPKADHPHDGSRYPLEGPCREDAAVEAHNRQSERGAEKKVRELVGKEDLGHLSARTRQQLGPAWESVIIMYLAEIQLGRCVELPNMTAIATNGTPCDKQISMAGVVTNKIHARGKKLTKS